MESKETPPPAEPQDDENALEQPSDETSASDSDAAALESNGDDNGSIDATSAKKTAAPQPKQGKLKKRLRRFNIYLLLFVFILLIAGVIAALSYFQSKKAATNSTLKTQELTQKTLEQIAASDATVGNPQQVLSVQSSAVFAGKVLIRQDLEVAGSLQIGGTVSLNNLAVGGATQLGQTQISKDLSVAGNSAVQGNATISKSLQVGGGATFSGPISAPQITTSNFQLNSDLTLTRHIIIGGGTPTRTNGPALGAGGTASNSGSDTAGSVSINVGSSPPAGCFVTINFAQKYNSTPRVLITPVGAGAGLVDYYVNRTATSFSICDASTPPTGTSFAFDYFVVN